MKNVKTKDWEWIAIIQYRDYPDSEYHIAGRNCPNMMSALADVHNHVKEHYPYEIISLLQQKYEDNK